MLPANITVRPVLKIEEARYQALMEEHHYLGSCPKIGETLWYISAQNERWISLISFSVSALKCKVRDEWIGWSYRHQFGRLKLITNNNRFLILPGWHLPNLGSFILSLCLKRLNQDWFQRFGHRIALVETFVDSSRFIGTIYKASNWDYIGETKGFRRKNQGYSVDSSPKKMFVKLLAKKAKNILSHPILNKPYQLGEVKMNLTSEQMQSLPGFFKSIPDPRRSQGRRHRLFMVLGISAGAVLCGMKGYKAISDWAKSLGQKARGRFGCRWEKGKYVVPCEWTFRDVLVRVEPAELDQALRNWNEAYGKEDESLAIDGKVMCNAIDKNGKQSHIMSVIGHTTKACYTQKKVGVIPVDDKSDEVKQTNEIKVAAPLLNAIEIKNKDITSDALHTQRDFADYIVEERGAHYYFTVKGNQPTLEEDISFFFKTTKGMLNS